MTSPGEGRVVLPPSVKMQMLGRLLLVQCAWNYQTMLGTGLGFALEPALRLLPGGVDGTEYKAALARQTGYFNAHPYLAAVAAGALANAELRGESHDRIGRFRTALSGPLGSIGDRLIWTGLLPACSLIALLAYASGATPLVVCGLFLALYNAGHLGLRIWGLNAGLSLGLSVSTALGGRLIRKGTAYIMRVAALLAGVVPPLLLRRLDGGQGPGLTVVLLLSALLALTIVLLGSRVQGWRAALAVLSVYALYAVVI